jgi:hypothetical protein
MHKIFAETLEQMDVLATGIDPASGQPAYSLNEVARALGVRGAELDPRAWSTCDGDAAVSPDRCD